MNVYVASPYENAPFVRVLHEKLELLGFTPISRWAETAAGVENFARYSPVQLREAARRNDSDLRAADVVLLVDLGGAGRETYADARVALEWGKSVIWVGRLTLSAWRRGVVRADDINEAFQILGTMRHAHAEGYRGELLAIAAERAVCA